jgi:hypothetical protein
MGSMLVKGKHIVVVVVSVYLSYEFVCRSCRDRKKSAKWDHLSKSERKRHPFKPQWLFCRYSHGGISFHNQF